MRSAACWDSGGDDDPRISGDHVRTVIQEQEDGRVITPKSLLFTHLQYWQLLFILIITPKLVDLKSHTRQIEQGQPTSIPDIHIEVNRIIQHLHTFFTNSKVF